MREEEIEKEEGGGSDTVFGEQRGGECTSRPSAGFSISGCPGAQPGPSSRSCLHQRSMMRSSLPLNISCRHININP